MAKSKAPKKNDTAANVGYEAQLWQMADALRGPDRRRAIPSRVQ